MMDDTTRTLQEYAERMKQIRLLSTPELAGITDADEYRATLLGNYSLIGEMARENRKVIDFLRQAQPRLEEGLTAEETEQLTSFVELLAQDSTFEEIDVHLSEFINDLLLAHEAFVAQSSSESARVIAMAKKVKRDYYIISGLTRYPNDELSVVRAAAIDNLKLLSAYLDKQRFGMLSDEAKGAVLQYSLMGAILYEDTLSPTPSAHWQEPLAILRQAEDILADAFYRDTFAHYDWETYEFRIYYYGSFLAYSHIPRDVAAVAHGYAQKMRDFLTTCTNERILAAVNEEQATDLLNLASVQAGMTPVREACDALWAAYEARDATDYSLTGVNVNLDTPSSFLSLAKTLELELTEEDFDRYHEIEKASLDYLYHIPKVDDTYLKCITCFTYFPLNFQEVPGAMTMEEFCVSAFAAIHPPTYVHTNMVARLAQCMTRHLLDSHPELFVGFPGCDTVEQVLASKGRVAHYAYHASLCHDIGKLFIIDTISMYGRNLLDDEFDIIKNHPTIGAQVAAEHASTREYVDVIRGHHLWYDGTRGYPADFDTSKSPYKTIIDIVLAADCLDAATDTVGRSYNRGKTFAEYEREVAEGAGTHYAPFLVELFQDPTLRTDIEYLLGKGRENLYRETFYLLKSNEMQ